MLFSTVTEISAPATNQWILEGVLNPGTPGTDSSVTRCPITKDRFRLGRHYDADLRLTSKLVSKEHAEILIAGDKAFIKDLDSTNGTFVNGNRISEATPVDARDLVQLANFEFRLKPRNFAPAHISSILQPTSAGQFLSSIHEVVHNRRFHMQFQPIVTAANRQTVGFEALLRPEVKGLESPAKAFESACQLGLENQLSKLCREQAASTLKTFGPAKSLFLNTHPNEKLGVDLIKSLDELRNKADSWRIVLEIHEQSIADVTTLRKFHDALKSMNIELAYDDFGVGQSRLRELAEVPPDFVKFDRSLLSGIARGSGRITLMVEMLVRFCREYGIQIVAEGVENQEEAQTCGQLGFTHLQGYFIGKPCKATELDDLATDSREFSSPLPLV